MKFSCEKLYAMIVKLDLCQKIKVLLVKDDIVAAYIK
jgi:hypothetical protein